MAREKLRDAVDDARSIDTVFCQKLSDWEHSICGVNLRLTFEVLHYVEELVIDVGLIGKLNFDLVEVAESVLISVRKAHEVRDDGFC